MPITKRNQIISLPYLGVGINQVLEAINPGHIICLSREKHHLAYRVWKGCLLGGDGAIAFVGRHPDKLYSVLLEVDGVRLNVERQYQCFKLGKGLICDLSTQWQTEDWFDKTVNSVKFDGSTQKIKRGRILIVIASLPMDGKVVFSLTAT